MFDVFLHVAGVRRRPEFLFCSLNVIATISLRKQSAAFAGGNNRGFCFPPTALDNSHQMTAPLRESG